MTTMRAAVYTEAGGPDVLRVVDREVPEPGPGEVRVRLVRAGVNPTDWKSRRAGPGEGGPAEVVPGQDGAGDLDALGEGVEEAAGLSVGDRVWLLVGVQVSAHGTAAEHVVLPAAKVRALPEGASYDLGASLGVPAVTAHRTLTAHEGGPTRLGPGTLAGRTVLVAGGAGAVGNAAIQLARWSGATVVSTVSSPEKAALASAAGAHHTVDYRASGDGTADAVRDVAPDGVDIVVEVAPAQNSALDTAVTAVHATVAVYANNGGDTMSVGLRETFSKNLRFQYVILYTLAPELLATAMDDVTAAVAAGALRVGEEAGLAVHHHPLDQVARAHQAVEDGVVGKVLLDL